MSENWRTEIIAEDFFGNQKKRVATEQRRPVVRKASDLVGPGINLYAVRITDFNDILATYNGYYSAEAGASNAPTVDGVFVGIVSGDALLGGVQVFTDLELNEQWRRTFTRNPGDPDSLSWTAWLLTS